MRELTTWRKEFEFLFTLTGDTLDGLVCTLTEEELDRKFNPGYGSSQGPPFTAWSDKYVYFPCVYDGAEWIGHVSRNPDGKATGHIGGQ